MKFSISILIILTVSLIGCQMQMTNKQFESAWNTETIQLTDEQVVKASDSIICQYLEEHKVTGVGLTVSEDVKFASSKVDKVTADLGGNRYYIKDSEWILDALGGTTLLVLFDVYRCDETKL